MSEPIYVIGFPKSGNTWLVRLLADALQARVRSHVMRGSPELAAEINERLGLPTDTKCTIAKIHFLPAMFLEEIDQTPKRIAYIYRDFRDVAVSAYFYFNNCNEADMQLSDFFSLLARGPWSLFNYHRNRKKMVSYIENLCRGNLEWFREFTGTWSQHINEWRDMMTQRSDVRFIFVSYEELLDDTASTLLQIIQQLALPEPSAARLHCAIERQSLQALKRHFQEIPSRANIPFTKEFNLKFLRKGKSGDWRNFLSSQMGQIIQKHQGEMLFDLGYETDPTWYERIPGKGSSSSVT